MPTYINTTTGETDALTRTAHIAVTREVTTVTGYDYDPLYCVTSATHSTGEVYTCTYDQVGNRLAMGLLVVKCSHLTTRRCFHVSRDRAFRQMAALS